MSALSSLAQRRIWPRRWHSCSEHAVPSLTSVLGRCGSSHASCLRRQCCAYSTCPSSEDITVPCKSNGSITLNVHHHPSAPSDPSRILVLYLPSGQALLPPRQGDRHPGLDPDAFALQHLLSSIRGTLVQVNYRAGEGVPYPTPVHDVLAGYDWVVNELGPSLGLSGSSRRHVRLGVCGQLLGGSLAAMLALTECRMGSDRVAAAVVNNPIGEWIFPSDVAQTKTEQPVTRESLAAAAASAPTRRSKKIVVSSWDRNAEDPLLSADDLIGLRSTLMQKPSQWFDPFVSPILFFRSAALGLALPGELATKAAETTTSDAVSKLHLELEEPSTDEETYNYDMSMIEHASPAHTHLTSSVNPPAEPSTPHQPLVPRRRAHRIYPPQGSALRLPNIHISTSPSSILHDQALDLAGLMRRSVARTALRSHAHIHPDVELPADDDARRDAVRLAERRVELDVGVDKGDGGLWMDSVEGARRLSEVGAWFRKKLS